jgi:hypothetical protein
MKQAVSSFLLGLVFNLEDVGNIPAKRQLTFTELHDAICQKTGLLITHLLTLRVLKVRAKLGRAIVQAARTGFNPRSNHVVLWWTK